VIIIPDPLFVKALRTTGLLVFHVILSGSLQAFRVLDDEDFDDYNTIRIKA
jgi:hypothetical protein